MTSYRTGLFGYGCLESCRLISSITDSARTDQIALYMGMNPSEISYANVLNQFLTRNIRIRLNRFSRTHAIYGAHISLPFFARATRSGCVRLTAPGDVPFCTSKSSNRLV